MKIQQPAILIPDECNNPLAYYLIRCLKATNKDCRINLIISFQQLREHNDWLTFYQHSAYIDKVLFAENEINSVAYLDEVTQQIESLGIDVVFPASENSFKFVSKYREQLSVLCKIVALPSSEALDISFDKWKLYLFLKEHNISIPETFQLGKDDNPSKLNYSVIIKPIDGCGGKDIQKIDCLAAEDSQVLLKYQNEAYIFQKYIHGYDMGCSVLCWQGKVLAYTIQQQLGESRGFSPKIDKLKFIHDSIILDIVSRTMEALQWNGIANLDLRYSYETGEIFLLEINPRFWQSLMGSLSIGVNFPHLLYLLSINMSLPIVSYEDGYYAKFSRFLKDVLNGSAEYSWSATNTKYFLSDPNSLFHLWLHRFFKKINHSSMQLQKDMVVGRRQKSIV